MLLTSIAQLHLNLIREAMLINNSRRDDSQGPFCFGAEALALFDC
jgi:hypothetical protein